MSLHRNPSGRGRVRALYALLPFVFSIASCATTMKTPSEGTFLAGVPFFRQEAYQCGPAALATVIDYWHAKTGAGRKVTPEDMAPAIYSPTARGVLGMDLERYAGKQGFLTRQYQGTIEDLRGCIDEATPPIILVDLGFALYQVNHFAVVTGYNTEGLFVNSGGEENRFIREGEFKKIWGKSGNWMLVVRPPA